MPHRSAQGPTGLRRAPFGPVALGARERGQVVPLVLVVVLVTGLLVLGVAQVGRAAGRRAAAQAAADAAALAGASDGRVAAGRVAAANRADLVAFEQTGDDVVVTVRRRGATATARARWLPGPIP